MGSTWPVDSKPSRFWPVRNPLQPGPRDAARHGLGSPPTGPAGSTGGTMAAEGFPVEGMELTHILVVEDAARARDFYVDVLGAELYREYGGTSVVLLVFGGGPTADKPDVTFAPPADPRTVAHAMTIRVPDCRAAYGTLRERGAVFLTPPVDYEWEVRCFFRDPDGHLLELSQSKAAAGAS